MLLNNKNLFITGFSGTGKTTVARQVADALGWLYVDTDDLIVEMSKMNIEDIFKDQGEDGFRKYEYNVLSQVIQRENQVVSTGGGIVVNSKNRNLMKQNGILVCLEASPETIHSRLSDEAKDSHLSTLRPMLKGSNALKNIEQLKATRQSNYVDADWIIQTDNLLPDDVSTEVLRAWDILSKRLGTKINADSTDSSIVFTSSGNYPISVGWGIIDEIGTRLGFGDLPKVCYVVTDEGAHLHGRRVHAALEMYGIKTHIFVMPAGEAHKNHHTVNRLYDWLSLQKAERSHMIISVGGGVVGDLAGFVAATYLRGIPFVQVPTTMLAMMDASVGGKTGIDLISGKNLVGAFHQPNSVIADVATLKTLPPRELKSGWVEAVKHGLILDKKLFSDFEKHLNEIDSLESEIIIDLIKRSLDIKGDVVSKDEKETLGVRILLNYGHTVGHAIETVTGYSKYLHGEAVSLGMMAAGHIATERGMLSVNHLNRQKEILINLGLPVIMEEINPSEIKEAMTLDKKVKDGNIRWVLLEGIGNAVVRLDVPGKYVNEALKYISHSSGNI